MVTCLIVSGEISLLIGQPLALSAFDGAFGPHGVVHTQLFPVVHSEIELAQITLQMLFAAMLIGANHPTLEHAEKALKRIGMDKAMGGVTDVFLGVIDRSVALGGS